MGLYARDEERHEMDESNQTTIRRARRPDLAWGHITRTSESGSFIEDQLATLVDVTTCPANFRVDVVQIDPEARL
ncbi:MAG: hypothetical protein ACJ74E_02020 [Actinomycetes bacterium]